MLLHKFLHLSTEKKWMSLKAGIVRATSLNKSDTHRILQNAKNKYCLQFGR